MKSVVILGILDHSNVFLSGQDDIVVPGGDATRIEIDDLAFGERGVEIDADELTKHLHPNLYADDNGPFDASRRFQDALAKFAGRECVGKPQFFRVAVQIDVGLAIDRDADVGRELTLDVRIEDRRS